MSNSTLNLTINPSNFLGKLAQQRVYETEWSLSGFREYLRDVLADIELDNYEEEFAKYVDSMKSCGIEHSDYHYDLMSSKVLTEAQIRKALSVVVEHCVFSHSYLEHRIVGYQVGKKLCPKTVKIGDKLLRSSIATKVSYGSNIVQFFKHKGLLTNKVFKGSDKHTHNCVELSPNFIDFLREKEVYTRSLQVRSGSANYFVSNHSTEEAGGYVLEGHRKLMINKYGFNHNSTQSDSVCTAVNKIQRVPYNLVSDDKLDSILREYRTADKWYDEHGVFMKGEWNKLISDIARFRGEEFYFTYSMDDVGRMYDGGNYLTIQGDKYQKAMLQIAGQDIVRVDAKNQSIKLYKILGGDATLDDDVREELANELNARTSSNVFTRNNDKYPLMVATYGAMQKQVLSQSKDIGCEFRDLFPVGMEDDDKYDIFVEALTEVAPGVVKIMNLIYRFNDEDKTFYSWVMPDGFKVNLTATDVVTHKGYYLDMNRNTTVSVSIEGRVELNSKFNRMLAPRLIHSIDAYIAREVVRRCKFHISLIHDSFGVLKENVNELIRVYNEVAAEVFEMNLLENILNQIDPTIDFRIKKGSLTREDVLNASLMEVEDK